MSLISQWRWKENQIRKKEEREEGKQFRFFIAVLFAMSLCVCVNNKKIKKTNYHRYLWILNKFNENKKKNVRMFYIHMIWYIFFYSKKSARQESGDPESKKKAEQTKRNEWMNEKRGKSTEPKKKKKKHDMFSNLKSVKWGR